MLKLSSRISPSTGMLAPLMTGRQNISTNLTWRLSTCRKKWRELMPLRSRKPNKLSSFPADMWQTSLFCNTFKEGSKFITSTPSPVVSRRMYSITGLSGFRSIVSVGGTGEGFSSETSGSSSVSVELAVVGGDQIVFRTSLGFIIVKLWLCPSLLSPATVGLTAWEPRTSSTTGT